MSKGTRCYFAGLTAAIFLSHAALADGVKVTTTCESQNQHSHQAQVKVTVIKVVDYRARKGTIQVDYSGSINWDAEPYSAQGNFTTAMPVSNDPVPNLLNTFEVQYEHNTYSEKFETDYTKMPLKMTRVILQVPTKREGFFSSRQFAHLEFVANTNIEGAAIGALYITDEAGHVSTPDRGASLSLNCESLVNDI